jgi:hypothetical protein
MSVLTSASLLLQVSSGFAGRSKPAALNLEHSSITATGSLLRTGNLYMASVAFKF